MSVISRNPFDLLGDGDSPAPAAAPAAAKSTTPATTKPAREIPGSKAPQGKTDDKPTSGAGRGRGGYYSRGGPRNVLKSNADKPTPDSEVTIVEPEQGFDGERRAPSKSDRGSARPRGHGEGSGRGRATRTRGRGGSYGGPAGGAGGFSGGERRNDGRRSAHALPDSEKKVASGWGADDGKAELTAEVEGAVDATKELAEPQTPAAEDVAGWGADVDTSAAQADAPAAEEAAAKPVEEEDNTKSYEEYLAERKAAASVPGKLEARTVEGTGEFVGSALKKVEDTSFFGGAKKDKAAAAAAEKAKKDKKEKVFLEVEGRFAPPSRGDRPERGGARGGRGGFRGSDRPARGGAGRGGARGGNRSAGNNAQAIAVDDATAFPALS